jgi:hypothetical protein
MILGRVGEYDQLFADQVIERTLCAEASLDRLRRPALFDPDLFEPHRGNIALTKRRAQSALTIAKQADAISL